MPSKPPFDLAAMRERNRLDELDEIADYARETPGERLEIGLQLSDLAREIARGAGARWLLEPEDDRADKARLYAAPLRALRPR